MWRAREGGNNIHMPREREHTKVVIHSSPDSFISRAKALRPRLSAPGKSQAQTDQGWPLSHWQGTPGAYEACCRHYTPSPALARDRATSQQTLRRVCRITWGTSKVYLGSAPLGHCCNVHRLLYTSTNVRDIAGDPSDTEKGAEREGQRGTSQVRKPHTAHRWRTAKNEPMTKNKLQGLDSNRGRACGRHAPTH